MVGSGKRQRLERIVALRRHHERQAWGALAEALGAQNRIDSKVEAKRAERSAQERALDGWREESSDELRLRHHHLFKLDRDLVELETDAKAAERTVALRRDSYTEARKEVRILETLLERDRLREAREELYRERKLLDEFGLRQYQGKRS